MGDIRYTFSASGASNVVTAFKNIGDAAESASSKVSKFNQQGGFGAGAGGAGGGGRRRAQQQALTTEQLAKRVARDQDLQHIRQEKRDAAHRERMARREADAMRRGTAIAERHRTRQNQALADFHRKQELITQRGIERTRDREAKALARSAKERRQAWRTFGGKALTAGVLLTGAALGVAARYTGKAVRENWDLEKQSASIATKGSMGADRMSTEEVQRKLQKTAMATPGVTAEDIGAGVGAFISKVGEGKKAMEFRDVMATMASASGARAEDIGSTMADAYSKLGVSSADEMKDLLARWHTQGKTGAFELSDMAKFMPRILAAGRVFGVDKSVEGGATIGALMQLVRGTTGSGAQAATGVENMLQTLVKKRDVLKSRLGVDVFDPSGRTRNLRDILPEIAAAGKGDVRTTTGIFTERGQKAMNAFFTMFKDLKDSGMSASEALAVMKSNIDEAIAPTGRFAEVTADAAQNQATDSAKMTAAWETFRNTIAKEVNPVLGEMGTKMSKWLGDDWPAQIAKVIAMVVAGVSTFVDALESLDKAIPNYEERKKEREEKAAREAALLSAKKEVEDATADLKVEPSKMLSPEGKEYVKTVKEARLKSAQERLAEFEPVTPGGVINEKLMGPTEYRVRAKQQGIPQDLIDETVRQVLKGGRPELSAINYMQLEGMPGFRDPEDEKRKSAWYAENTQRLSETYAARGAGGERGEAAESKWASEKAYANMLDVSLKAKASGIEGATDKIVAALEASAKNISAASVWGNETKAFTPGP